MSLKLGVNIDHVATIRQARGTEYPSVTDAASLAAQGGAHGITVHLREDRRHIQLKDVEDLKRTLSMPLNLEMAATQEMQQIAATIQPAEVCLVPERREELTTEGGLDVAGQQDHLQRYCSELQAHHIKVSLFIDPSPLQINAAAKIGAELVELHTGRYADVGPEQEKVAALTELENATKQARELGMVVNAGHGLNYDNVGPVAAIVDLNCLNIGHAIVARAITVGLEQAVREMLATMRTRA